MLYYDRIIVSEETNAIKKSKSKECAICHHWNFLDKGFNFQLDIYNDCHGVLMMSDNLNGIAILNKNVVDCCCIISGISKSETIKIMQNIDFPEKSGTL